MSVPSRYHTVIGTYFVTLRTWQSRPLFVSDSFCRVFVDALIHYRDEGAYSLHAFVLMPDYFHVLLTPSADMSLERAVQYIKGGSALRPALEKNMHFPVWQRGFSDHRIRDAADFVTHIRYIRDNPARRKLVLQPEESSWSSAFAAYVLNEPPQGLKPLQQEEGAILPHG